MFPNKLVMAVIVVLVQGSLDIRKTGWLDRLVEYHRQNFIQDLHKIPDVQLRAKVANAPPGYLDSEDWDYPSVLRLLSLIRQSEGLGPVRRVLRHALHDTRRMSIRDSLKLFPSLHKELPNDLYYDIQETIEYYDDAKTPRYSENKTIDNAIIVVSNPVEARLPSAMISVQLLKEILENRANAARYMPKTKMTIIWKVNNTRLSSSAPQDITTLGVSEGNGSGNSSSGNTTSAD